MKINFRELCYYFFCRLPQELIGKCITKNIIRVHWGRGLNNFGDCLQPYILKHYGLRPIYVSSYNKSDILLQGTLLQWIPEEYKGVILGTGGDNFNYKFYNSCIIGVRGKLTKNNLQGIEDRDIILGDPGLLMKYVFPNQVKKKFKLGIVLHFVDEEQNFAKLWRDKFLTPDVKFIKVCSNVEKVINEIKQCDAIVSSSLHGLIISDAFGIPNRRIVNRLTMPTDFYDYKFWDYYTSIDFNEDPFEVSGKESLDQLLSTTTLKPQEKINDLIERLDQAMVSIAGRFKK